MSDDDGMAVGLDISNMAMNDVRDLLKFQEHLDSAIASLLSLEPLTESEHQEVSKIRQVFRSYHNSQVREPSSSLGADYEWIGISICLHAARKPANLSTLPQVDSDVP